MLEEMIVGFIVFSLLIGLGIMIAIFYFITKVEKVCPQEECNRTEATSIFCRKCGKRLIKSDFAKKLIKRLK